VHRVHVYRQRRHSVRLPADGVLNHLSFMPELSSFGEFLEEYGNPEIKQVGDWDSPCFEATVHTREFSMFFVPFHGDSDTEPEEAKETEKAEEVEEAESSTEEDQVQEKRQKTTE
jgi:hypothetical protein